MHCNIINKRRLIDFWQALRCQRPVFAQLGRPFRRSRRRVEIDHTYRCNMRCANCNRSCTQAPAAIDDERTDLQECLCPLCGHVGFAWPAKRPQISPAWQDACANYCDRQAVVP